MASLRTEKSGTVVLITIDRSTLCSALQFCYFYRNISDNSGLCSLQLQGQFCEVVGPGHAALLQDNCGTSQ